MGEQNRRTVDLERTRADEAKPRPTTIGKHAVAPPPPGSDRALSTDADERQTLRQAPTSAAPGEGSEDDGIG